MSKAVVFFADGMEECEALLVVDLLRRGGVEVTTASVMEDRQIVSSHKVPVLADALAGELDYTQVDLVVYPGGIPGSNHLAESQTATRVARDFAAQGKYVGAVCAAPAVVLAPLGVLEGKQATSYPSFQDQLTGAVKKDQPVAVDGKIITGRALGAGIPFALELLAALEGRETARKVAQAIVYDWE